MSTTRDVVVSERSINDYLSGKRLYGDDFSGDEIREWYQDEKEAYGNLGAADRDRYSYSCHALNAFHGFSALPDRRFHHCLGFGSAYGDELTPIIDRLDHVTIIDPSDAFRQHILGNVPVDFVAPLESGNIPFADYTFDLITALGVLHHIPNVTHVVKELYRCLKPRGILLLREPIASMGDWSKPRPRLTKRERGIPAEIVTRIVASAGFRIISGQYCMFPAIRRLSGLGGIAPYDSALLTRLDWILSSLFRWNRRYHATSVFGKLQPTSLYFVLERPVADD